MAFNFPDQTLANLPKFNFEASIYSRVSSLISERRHQGGLVQAAALAEACVKLHRMRPVAQLGDLSAGDANSGKRLYSSLGSVVWGIPSLVAAGFPFARAWFRLRG
jgi:hypothetical protein